MFAGVYAVVMQQSLSRLLQLITLWILGTTVHQLEAFPCKVMIGRLCFGLMHALLALPGLHIAVQNHIVREKSGFSWQ
jgi:hypothetical protein